MPAQCHREEAPEDPRDSLFQDGELALKTHQVGWIVAGICCILALIITTWHVRKHLIFFTSPRHQRYIVRILFMCPFYAVLSFSSYFFWRQALFFELVRDSYEALVITSFFYLILEYVGGTTVELGIAFRNSAFDKWMWPLGSIKSVPRPWTMLQICKIGVLQYIILRPLTTLLAVIFEVLELYCLTSWSPTYFHLYDVLIVSISVTIAMYCLLQVMVAMHDELQPARPMLKFLAVKGLVFVIFWQSVVVGVLGSYGWGVKATKYWTLHEVEAGVEALLITFEMVLFALFQVKAFTYIAYRPEGGSSADRKDLRTKPWRALLKVMDFRDMGREVAYSTVYLSARIKGRDPLAGRDEDHEKVFGQHRQRVDPDVEKAERKARKARKKAGLPEDELTDIERDLQALREKEVDPEPFDDMRPLLAKPYSPLPWTSNLEEVSFGVVDFPPSARVPMPPEHARSEASFASQPQSRGGTVASGRSRSRDRSGGLGISGVPSPTHSSPAFASDPFTAWPGRVGRPSSSRRQSQVYHSTPPEERSAFLPDVICPPAGFDPTEFGRLMLGIDDAPQAAQARHSLNGPLRLPRQAIQPMTGASPPSRRYSLDQGYRAPKHPDLSPPRTSPSIVILPPSRGRKVPSPLLDATPPARPKFVFDEV